MGQEGFEVSTVDAGDGALVRVASILPDIVLLDLHRPVMDGLAVCAALRNDPSLRGIPVVILTSCSSDDDVVAGLELGADDVVTRPISHRVLVARLRAALQRRADTEPGDGDLLRRGPITLAPAQHEARVDDEIVSLTATEFGILVALARRPGRVLSRSQILHALHGADCTVTDRAVDVHVLTLRRKLGRARAWIETVRGLGYRFRAAT
jgi:two-component system phosphate regulon response regulator PhoB